MRMKNACGHLFNGAVLGNSVKVTSSSTFINSRQRKLLETFSDSCRKIITPQY